MLYLKLAFMLLFLNIALIMAIPSDKIGSNMLTENNVFFDINTDGDEDTFVIDQSLQTKAESLADADSQPGFLDSLVSILDPLKVIWDFLRTILLIFGFSILISAQLSSINPYLGLIIGVPITLAYVFSIIGWLRSGN